MHKVLFASGLLIGSTLALDVSAQNAPASAAAGVELEEIVVTAEKREVNLQKTAISIQVYSGEDLRKQGKKRIDEIMQGVVGVGTRDSNIGNVFFIRGVDAGGGNGSAATATATTVPVMVDGAYQARRETVRGGTLDLAQAEVMRGTQSTNLGANALAGAVSLVTNKPVLGEYHTTATLEVGNYNLLSGEGVANIPLADQHAIRIAYAQNNRDGYSSNDSGNSRLTNARIKYRYQPGDTLDFVLTAGRQIIGGNGVQLGNLTYSGVWEPYSASRATANCSATVTTNCYITRLGFPYLYGLLPTPGQTYKDRKDPWNDGLPKNPWSNNPGSDTKINTVALEVNWDTPIGKFTAIPTIERARFTSVSAQDGTGTYFISEDSVSPTNQLDVRLASKDGGRLSWLVGGWYFKTRQSGPFEFAGYSAQVDDYPTCGPTNNSPQIINNGSNLCRITTYTDGGVETKSLYANLSFKLTDAFRLKAGLRTSSDNKFLTYSLSRRQGGYDYIGGSGTSSGPTFARIATPAGQTTCPTYACVGGFNYSSFTGYKLASYEHTWRKMSWSTGIEYDVLPNAMAYASYQTGYQPGILNVMGASGSVAAGTAAPAPTYGPDNTSKQSTVGFKSRWLENKLQFNIEAFQIDIDSRPFGGTNSNLVVVGNAADSQCAFLSPGALTGSVALSQPAVPGNYSCLVPSAQLVADNRSRGLDLEVNFLPTANDRLDLSLEYLDATYSGRPNLSGFNPTVKTIMDSATANTASGTPLATSDPAQATALATNLLNLYNTRLDSFVGKQLQNASKYSTNFSYEHRFMFGNGNSVAPKVNAEYKSAYWTQGGTVPPTGYGLVDLLDKGSLVRQDSYVLWNASLDYATSDGKFSVNAYVKNIQNKPIMINIGGEPGVAVNYVSLQPPRTFGVVFSARL